MIVPCELRLAGMRGWPFEITYNSTAYWIWLGLLLLVLVGVVVKAYREWQEIQDVEEPDSPDDLLVSFRTAHAAGELDDEEFRRVQERLSGAGAMSERRPGSDDPAQIPAEKPRSDVARVERGPLASPAHTNAGPNPPLSGSPPSHDQASGG